MAAGTQLLDAPRLVHQAYLRLIGPGRADHWAGRRHFFSVVADAAGTSVWQPT
jgi:hypothetical protein